MTNYYIEKENKIIGFDTNKTRLQRTVGEDVEILETERPIVLSEDGTYYVFADTDEYLQEQVQKEAKRIAMLKLTGADVERGIYKAKGMDFDDIVELVEQYNQTDPMSETRESTSIDIKALKIELKANNFYRGNPYIDVIGTLIGFSKQQLDEFFETNDYTKLLTTLELTNTNNKIQK